MARFGERVGVRGIIGFGLRLEAVGYETRGE